MSTEVDSFTLTSGNQFDVGHKDGGLTFDIETGDKEWSRYVIPWDQFPRFIRACFMATVYNGYRDSNLVWFYGDDLEGEGEGLDS